MTVYGQLIIKWQVTQAGSLPTNVPDRIWFLGRLILNPWIITSLIAGFFALLFWIVVMTKFDVSYAYPFMSSAFILVLVLSRAFFGEPITLFKALGIVLIMAGIIVASRG
jgi:multidrug transporter EmrE-like cation transporter